MQGILDGTIDEKEREQYLTIVLDETKRLNALISDLLDLAKVESGQFPLHRTEWDLNEAAAPEHYKVYYQNRG